MCPSSSEPGAGAATASTTGRWQKILELLPGLAVVMLTLLPMLMSGWYGDDEANSLLVAKYLKMTGQTLLGLMAKDISNWAVGAGRFYPLSEYGRPLFWLLNGNVVAYKFVLMGLVLLNAAQLFWLVKRLVGSGRMATLAVVAFALTLQFRFYHEPILSYTGLLPIIAALVLGALLWYLRFLDGEGTRYLILSVGAFVVSLLIYEVALPMFLLFFAVALVYPSRRRLAAAAKASWAYAAAAGAMLALVFVVRAVVGFKPGVAASAYTPNFAPVPVVTTIVKQMLATIPLTYYASRLAGGLLGATARPLYASPLQQLVTHPVSTLLSGAAFAAVTWWCLRPAPAADADARPASQSVMVLSGLAFLVLPNLLISLSTKHQLGVSWGTGYLPVYVSGIGLGLLVVAGVVWLRDRDFVRRNGLVLAVALTVLVGVVGALNFNNNRTTVEALNRARYYPAQVASAAARAGLMAQVPDGAWLLTNDDTQWETPEFYQLYAGKSLGKVVPVLGPSSLDLPVLRANGKPSAESTSFVVDPSGPPVYYLHVESGTRDSGYALLSRVESATVTGERVSVGATPLMVYRTWPGAPFYDWQQVVGWPGRPSSYEPTMTAGPALIRAPAMASGGDWVMQSVPDGWTVTESGFTPADGRSWINFSGLEWLRVR